MSRPVSAPTKRRTLARYLAVPLAVGALVLSGCASTPEAPGAGGTATGGTTQASLPASDTGAFLDDHGLKGLDATQVIDRLDAMPLAERPANLMASVRPDQLTLTDDQKRQATLPIPEDKFYLSFAPFRSQTHSCHFHSLTTCTGEMQNEEISVLVTDAKTGEKIVDKKMSTFDNGFVGLWLPRGIDATLSIEAQGKKASTPISTQGTEDATCLTTLQLK